MGYCADIFPISERFLDFLHDETKTVGSADTISFPANHTEVCMQLKYFNENDIPVTIQGNRTGLTAASVPNGGHIMSLNRMCSVTGMRVDENGTVFLNVQPGISLGVLRNLIVSRSFDTADWDENSMNAYEKFKKLPHQYFPPDPTETSASIGGMVACNASGAKTYRYGSTRVYINGVKVALSDGDSISLQRGQVKAKGRDFSIYTDNGRIIEGRLPDYTMPSCKNASGYFAEDDMDMVDLFVGSDGTLGVITEIELRLIPQPNEIWGVNCFFENRENAVSFVEKIREKGRNIVAIEYFDGNALEILRSNENYGKPVPDKYKSLIYVEIHADDDNDALDEIWLVGNTMLACGGNTEDTWAAKSILDRERLLELRHKVPESVNALIASRKRKIPKLAKVASDMAVPDDKLRDIIKVYDEDLAANNFEFAIWGHIGNNHLHVNVLPNTEEDMVNGKEMFKKWAKIVTEMGGTVSAEHGTGKTKAAFLPILYGENGVRQMAEVKRLFDPKCILGAGNMFPAEYIR